MPRRFASVSSDTNAMAISSRSVGQLRDRRRDRRHAGSRRHCHGQDVVDDQRRAGEQAGVDADVRLRDVVSAAATRIRLDQLHVREGNDRRQRRDGHGDGHGVVQRASTREDQHQENFLRRVRGGREVVGGEDGQRLHLAQTLVRQVRRGDRSAQDDVTDASDSARPMRVVGIEPAAVASNSPSPTRRRRWSRPRVRRMWREPGRLPCTVS